MFVGYLRDTTGSYPMDSRADCHRARRRGRDRLLPNRAAQRQTTHA